MKMGKKEENLSTIILCLNIRLCGNEYGFYNTLVLHSTLHQIVSILYIATQCIFQSVNPEHNAADQKDGRKLPGKSEALH